MKTNIEKAKNQRIIKVMMNYICLDTEMENEFASAVEIETEGEITKEEFHDWFSKFDIKKSVK